MKIYVESRKYFLDLTEHQKRQMARDFFIISINTPFTSSDKDGRILDPIEKVPFPTDVWNDICILYFHDIEKATFKSDVLFDQSHVEKIESFIDKILRESADKYVSRQGIIVHCTMGVSRSGAVGEFLNVYFNRFLKTNMADYESFLQNNGAILPNGYVKSMLMRELIFKKAEQQKQMTALVVYKPK